VIKILNKIGIKVKIVNNKITKIKFSGISKVDTSSASTFMTSEETFSIPRISYISGVNINKSKNNLLKLDYLFNNYYSDKLLASNQFKIIDNIKFAATCDFVKKIYDFSNVLSKNNVYNIDMIKYNYYNNSVVLKVRRKFNYVDNIILKSKLI